MALTDERKLLLLGLLRQNDMHGYLLNAHLDGTVPISLKKPTAYHLLERMEADGWIAHRDEPTGERPRRVFSLTARGERAFRDLLTEQLRGFRPAEFPSAVGLAFLDALPAAEARSLLIERRRAVAGYRDHLAAPAAGAPDAAAAHDESAVGPHLAVAYARRFVEVELELLDQAIDHLGSAGEGRGPA